MSYKVYCLETDDGRKYVGTTSTSLRVRWNNGNGYRSFPRLWEQICAVGWDNIKKTILAENVTCDEASKLEQMYISEYDTCNPDKGFNSELGGIGSHKIVSEKTKSKMSTMKTGKLNPNYGKHFSVERKKKIAESNRGKKRSHETCIRVGLAKEIPVGQFAVDGKLIATWDSGKKAAIATGIQAGHISKVCKHQRKTAGGYVWAYM